MAHRAGIETIGKPQIVSKPNDFYVPLVAITQDRENLGNFNSITDWAALSTDTTGLEVDVIHLLGTKSIEFDKVNGAANTIFSGATLTLSKAVDCSRFSANDKIYSALYVSSIANIAYAYIRLGTDASNYNEWRLDDTSITAGIWQVFSVALSATELAVTGDGWDPSAVAYINVGTAHDIETDALADIRFDHLFIATSQLTST